MSVRSKKQKKIEKLNLKDKRKIENVEQKLKIEKERAIEMNTWGLQSDLFAIILKCRLLEDLIDAAQRTKLKADKDAERELQLLKLLSKKTENDIHGFLEARNKQRWRTWDNPRDLSYNKRHLISKEVSDYEINLMWKMAKRQYGKICILNDQIGQDGETYVLISRVMVDFVSKMFGNQGWLLMNKAKRLRELQSEETKSAKTAAFSETDFKEGLDRQKTISENRRSSLGWLKLTNHKDLGIYTQQSEPVDLFETQMQKFAIKN